MKFCKYQSLLSFLFLMGMSYAKNKDTYYDEKEILAETEWKGLSVQENAPLHLSVISQGTEISDQFHKYDKNYYYPSSAGENIDVYVFDSGFNFTYSEFDNVYAKCELIIENGAVTKPENETVCYSATFLAYHGSMVSSAIAGKFSGVAKKANIHGILFKDDFIKKSEDQDPASDYIGAIVSGLEYLKDNKKIIPHKTVINFSSRFKITHKDFKEKDIYEKANELFKEISDMGAVVVAGAGNDGKVVSTDEYAYYPCSFESVICAGGVGFNDYEITQGSEIEDIIRPSFYKLGDYLDGETKSSYGKIDLYSPFLFHYVGGFFYDSLSGEFFNVTLPSGSSSNDTGFIEVFERIIPGTSFSTPITSGVIATLMSEFPERNYTTETIRQYLINNAIENIITDLPYHEEYPNLFLNNGKKIVYNATLTTDDDFSDDENIVSDDEVDADVQIDLEVEEVDSSEENDSSDKQ